MKVLLLSRKDLFEKTGGDTVQVNNIFKRLKEEKGIEVFLQTQDKANMYYDIVHIFNSYNIDETLENIESVRKRTKKIILTPIYHSEHFLKEMINAKIDLKKYLISNLMNFSNFMSFNNTIKQLHLKNYYVLKRIFKSYKEKKRLVFNNVDLIMPNSYLEKEYILKEVEFENQPKFNIIFNGVNHYLNEALMSEESKENPSNKYLLCIGRIEPLKNQLSIISGFKDSKLYKQGYSLLFCGSSNGKKYFEKFSRKIAEDSQLVYCGQLPQKELFSLLNKASGLVHASWFETTGLIGLEAGIFNVPVIMTNRGYTKSYFEDHVNYCDPKSIPSIRKAIDSLFDIDIQQKKQLSKKIKDYYNWDSIVECTLQEYKKLFTEKD